MRRERARESAAGITGYATDADHRVAAAALAGQLVVADLVDGHRRAGPGAEAVIDPRPDPTGTRVAWVDGRQLWVAELADPSSRPGPRRRGRPRGALGRGGVRRRRGDGPVPRLLVGTRRHARCSPLGSTTRRCSDGGSPIPRTRTARPRRSPTPPPAPRTPTSPPGSCGSTATRTEVRWDREDLPYLAEAAWDDHGPLLALHPRDQRRIEVRGADPRSGATEALWTDRDDVWVERAPGTPARLADGRVVMVSDAGRPPSARGGRHPRHPRRPPRARRRARRRRPRRVHRQPDRRRHRHLRVAVVRRRARAAHRRRRRAQRGGRRRHGRGAPRVARRPRPRGGRGRRPAPRRRASPPRWYPERVDPPRRRAPPGHRPRCSPTTSATPIASRCCSTRTAGPTPNGSCRPAPPTSPPSGSPTRASPSS